MISASMIAIGLLSNSSTAIAQDRPNVAPHGGAVAKAGNYHIEMLKSGDAVDFYLLDAAKKSIPIKGITAKGSFTFTDGTNANMDLEPVGDDRLRAVLFTASEFSVTVIFTVNKEVVSARFDSGRRQPVLQEKPRSTTDGHQH